MEDEIPPTTVSLRDREPKRFWWQSRDPQRLSHEEFAACMGRVFWATVALFATTLLNYGLPYAPVHAGVMVAQVAVATWLGYRLVTRGYL